MNYKRVVEEIVAKFLLNTCRMRPQLSESAVQAAVRCVEAAATHPVDEAETNCKPLITGSVAEFYIEPMLPQYVGDIDVMYHLSWQYHKDIHHRRSYQLSFTTMSRYLRLMTVTYLATCT